MTSVSGHDWDAQTDDKDELSKDKVALRAVGETVVVLGSNVANSAEACRSPAEQLVNVISALSVVRNEEQDEDTFCGINEVETLAGAEAFCAAASEAIETTAANLNSIAMCLCLRSG